MQVFDALLPEKCARHTQRLAPKLEEVQQNDENRDEQENHEQPPNERHLVAEIQLVVQPTVDRSLTAKKTQKEQQKARNGKQQQGNERQRKPRSLEPVFE